jgi:hypothetical protein
MCGDWMCGDWNPMCGDWMCGDWNPMCGDWMCGDWMCGDLFKMPRGPRIQNFSLRAYPTIMKYRTMVRFM